MDVEYFESQVYLAWNIFLMMSIWDYFSFDFTEKPSITVQRYPKKQSEKGPFDSDDDEDTDRKPVVRSVTSEIIPAMGRVADSFAKDFINKGILILASRFAISDKYKNKGLIGEQIAKAAWLDACDVYRLLCLIFAATIYFDAVFARAAIEFGYCYLIQLFIVTCLAAFRLYDNYIFMFARHIYTFNPRKDVGRALNNTFILAVELSLLFATFFVVFFPSKIDFEDGNVIAKYANPVFLSFSRLLAVDFGNEKLLDPNKHKSSSPFADTNFPLSNEFVNLCFDLTLCLESMTQILVFSIVLQCVFAAIPDRNDKTD